MTDSQRVAFVHPFSRRQSKFAQAPGERLAARGKAFAAMREDRKDGKNRGRGEAAAELRPCAAAAANSQAPTISAVCRPGLLAVALVICICALPSGSVKAQAPAFGPPSGSPARAYSMRAHRCPTGQAEAIASQLRREMGGLEQVRIAADPRTSQILVYGPEGLQQEIAARLAAMSGGPPPGVTPGAAPGAGGPQSPQPTAGRPASRSVQLHRSSGAQLERALLAALGQRLAAYPAPRPDTTRYHLALPRGGGLDLAIDHQSGWVTIEGAGQAVEACARLVRLLDQPAAAGAQSMQLISFGPASRRAVQRAAGAIHQSSTSANAHLPMVAMLFQAPGQPPAGPPAGQPGQPGTEAAGLGAPPAGRAGPMAPGGEPPLEEEGGEPSPGGEPAPEGPPPGEEPEEANLVGSVQVELLEGLDVLVVRGLRRDVERVVELIEQIERLSAEAEPAVEVYHLRHVESLALAELLVPLYEEIYLPRQGAVSITALVKPNALLLIGRPENVGRVIELVQKLDRPVAPHTQFRVFRLRYAAAATAQATVEQFFAEREGLGPRVLVVADFRSNSLIVQAGPRDLEEVAAVVQRLDTPVSRAVNELRVFQLQNSLAEDIAPILQQAIAGQGVPGAGAQAAQAAAGGEQKSVMLRFMTIDREGRRQLRSGILTDVRVTADVRSNSLLVSAPEESMELIGALVRQLDGLPAVEAQIKVFTIVNGDASSLAEMLGELFAEPAADQPAVQTAAVEGESSLVPLRFAVDVRTNSIIATGTRGDLQVVEAILLRLDESDARKRQNTVYRLKNSPAVDVATAINEFLQSERQVEQLQPGLLSPFEQVEREVIVVPEPVSNSLIVSATPHYYDEIMRLVEELDERPPMVMIQVILAEVVLNDMEELGFELGLQDSVLFNRSLLSDIVTTTATTFNELGNPVSSNEVVTSATYNPGFNFNNQPLGLSSGQGVSGVPRWIGTQGLSHFSLGRINGELGYGGFVFAASSESVSVLIRALKECRRLDILSRPQIMTLDNQPAFIQVGERVPRVTGVQINETGQINNVTLENVGLILGVTPRISPDGLVVMEIDAEKSKVGPEEDGVPISISATGEVIRSPKIETITAQTTVSAASGQTVVLGGLITKDKQVVSRKVPLLGDLPGVGFLFRYDGKEMRRTELLIIMTPHVVYTKEDADRIRQVEAARLHWCLSDVVEMHEGAALRSRSDEWEDWETQVIYPDMDPAAAGVQPGAPVVEGPEIIPAPQPAQQFVPAEPSQQFVPGPELQSVPVPDEAPLLPLPDSSAPGPEQGPVQLRLREPPVAPDSAQQQPRAFWRLRGRGPFSGRAAGPSTRVVVPVPDSAMRGQRPGPNARSAAQARPPDAACQHAGPPPDTPRFAQSCGYPGGQYAATAQYGVPPAHLPAAHLPAAQLPAAQLPPAGLTSTQSPPAQLPPAQLPRAQFPPDRLAQDAPPDVRWAPDGVQQAVFYGGETRYVSGQMPGRADPAYAPPVQRPDRTAPAYAPPSQAPAYWDSRPERPAPGWPHVPGGDR